jgi:hypothetical protein
MNENWNFERSMAMVESYKLLQDWSKWLITLELAICTGLWTKLTGTPKPHSLLYASWFMFLASIITASILLIIISFCVRRFAISASTNAILMNIFLVLEYLFFLLGLLALAVRIGMVWMTPEAN